MSELRSKIDNFVIAVSRNINALNAAITGKVSTQIFNNQTTQFTGEINQLTIDLNEAITLLEYYKGMHFESNQSASIIYLKNGIGTVITEINVGFLNNEGTTFFYNSVTQNLELKNDFGDVLSAIPIAQFVTNLASSIDFNPLIPHKLELKNANGNVSSFVNLGIQNIQGLETRFNSIKTIYSSDDFLSGNRIINITDKYLRFTSNTDTVEIKDSKLTIPTLFTNKYGGTQSGQIMTFILNNNLPKILFGNNDTNELEINSKNYIFKNMKQATNQNKTVTINDLGELAYIDGTISGYTPGEGIDITNGIISLIPADKINLIFNW